MSASFWKHANGKYSSLRILDYTKGAVTHPHPDASGFTLVHTTATLLVLDPQDTGIWWAIPPPPRGSMLLMIGSHLEESISGVHRVLACDHSRKAVTFHVKADHAWPRLSADEQPRSIPTIDRLCRDVAWDAELFARDLTQCQVPTNEMILAHFRLLKAIVNGKEGSVCRLPSPLCTGYWQLQTIRYFIFLQIHRNYPNEAKGILPPREIHHVWICHMLHPKDYAADCMELLGGVLPHDNNIFDLDGCSRFHVLWKRVTGASWPQKLIKEERARASLIATFKDDPVSCLRANLWWSFDSLASIYDGVENEMQNACHQAISDCLEFEETRLDYWRFLVAASYTCHWKRGIEITPPCLVDLVWHSHQTNPESYRAAMDELPMFVDHESCGILNQKGDGLERIQYTNEIWKSLYGRGVDLGSHTIYCGPPEARRPDSIQQQMKRAKKGCTKWSIMGPTQKRITKGLPSVRI